MSLIGRPEAVLRLAVPVVVVHLGDLEHRQLAAALVGEGDAAADGSLVHGEAHREGPRKPVREPHRLDDALVVRAAHEALERRERA